MNTAQRLEVFVVVCCSAIAGVACGESPGTPVLELCGNGVIEETEQCDATALGGQTCVGLGNVGGSLGCGGDCTYDTSNCVPANSCGNGVAEPAANEDCDGTELGSGSCDALGLGGGDLSCTADCVYDTSRCEAFIICGNGVIDPADPCDDGNAEPWDGCDECRIREFLLEPVHPWPHFAGQGVGLLDDGRFLITWGDFDSCGEDLGCVWAQWYTAEGTPDGSEMIVAGGEVTADGSDGSLQAQLAMAPTGEHVLVWANTWSNMPNRIRARCFGANRMPLGPSFTVVVPDGTHIATTPLVASADDGRFVVVWEDEELVDDRVRSLYAQRFDASCQAQGGVIQVNHDDAVGSMHDHDLDMAPDGRFTVVWNNSITHEINMRRFGADGTPESFDLLASDMWNNYLYWPRVAMAANGRLLVTWGAFIPSQSMDLFGLAFDADGVSMGSSFNISESTDYYQWDVSATAHDNGFIVTWNSERTEDGDKDVLLRHFDFTGVPLTGELLLNTHPAGSNSGVRPALLRDGRLLVVWGNSAFQGPAEYEYFLFAQRFDPSYHSRGVLPW